MTATPEGLWLYPLMFLPYGFARLLRRNSAGLALATAQGLETLRPPYEKLLHPGADSFELLLSWLAPTRGEVPTRCGAVSTPSSASRQADLPSMEVRETRYASSYPRRPLLAIGGVSNALE